MANRQIFISHSSLDAPAAQQVVGLLEARGFQCWMAGRDIGPGQNYQEAIVRALRDSGAVVFLFSEGANASREVKKELSLASGFGLPVLPLRLAQVRPVEALMYELATTQWIDGWPDRQVATDRLIAALDAHFGAPEPAPAPRPRAITLRDDQADALRTLLVRHVGPIARVLLQRAVAEAPDTAALLESLAGYVPNPADRAIFHRAALAVLRQ